VGKFLVGALDNFEQGRGFKGDETVVLAGRDIDATNGSGWIHEIDVLDVSRLGKVDAGHSAGENGEEFDLGRMLVDVGRDVAAGKKGVDHALNWIGVLVEKEVGSFAGRGLGTIYCLVNKVRGKWFHGWPYCFW